MFRTKKQHNDCVTCPIARTADLIGDSTVLLIVRDLAKQAQRFTDLQKSLPRISTRTLTAKLKLLEKRELILKHTYAEFPPRVLYELTKRGKGLIPIIAAMDTYGKAFLK